MPNIPEMPILGIKMGKTNPITKVIDQRMHITKLITLVLQISGKITQ